MRGVLPCRVHMYCLLRQNVGGPYKIFATIIVGTCKAFSDVIYCFIIINLGLLDPEYVTFMLHDHYSLSIRPPDIPSQLFIMVASASFAPAMSLPPRYADEAALR